MLKRRRGLAAALAALGLAGCANSAVVQQVADRPVIEVKDQEQARPIQFRKIVIKMKRGEEIGAIQEGLLCVPQGKLVYRGGRMELDDDDLTQAFRHELESANYKVVGDPDALFDDPSTWKAEYLIAGLVKRIQANVCYPMIGWGDTDARGEAFMEVAWQVYSRLDRKVVYEQTTQGSGKIEEKRAGGDTDVFLDAFAQATRNLLADRGFHDLVAGGGAVRTSDTRLATPVAGAPLERVAVAPRKPLTGPLDKNIDTVRRNVVTIFAGDGHGSGFFIDDAGHVLTNEHVVGAADHVKIKFASGRETVGTVIATNARRDVALIETYETANGLPLRLARPKIGSEVYAVGSPLEADLSTTVTKGIVSAYRTRDGLDFIQSDVSILPGNSGGPLLDANGNVIGITVSAVELSDVPVGVNFFIPIGDALDRLGIQGPPSS